MPFSAVGRSAGSVQRPIFAHFILNSLKRAFCSGVSDSISFVIFNSSCCLNQSCPYSLLSAGRRNSGSTSTENLSFPELLALGALDRPDAFFMVIDTVRDNLMRLPGGATLAAAGGALRAP